MPSIADERCCCLREASPKVHDVTEEPRHPEGTGPESGDAGQTPTSAPTSPRHPGASSESPGEGAPGGATALGITHPLVIGAVLVALLGATARAFHAPADRASASASAAPASSYEAPCPAGSVADFPPVEDTTAPPNASAVRRAPVCVPVPRRPDPTETGASETLPRRTERPEDFARYLLPVDTGEAPAVPSGPSGASVDTVYLAVAPNQPVRALRLEGQTDATRVVFVTERSGWTVVTAHTIPRERGTSTVLLVYDGLAAVEPALSATSAQSPVAREGGAPLGLSGSEGLRLSAKQLRRDVPLVDALPELAPATVLPTDVRNVLPLRAK